MLWYTSIFIRHYSLCRKWTYTERFLHSVQSEKDIIFFFLQRIISQNCKFNFYKNIVAKQSKVISIFRLNYHFNLPFLITLNAKAIATQNHSKLNQRQTQDYAIIYLFLLSVMLCAVCAIFVFIASFFILQYLVE